MATCMDGKYQKNTHIIFPLLLFTETNGANVRSRGSTHCEGRSVPSLLPSVALAAASATVI